MANNKAAVKDLISIELPVHIGFIMDGNGRWAGKRGLPRKLDIGKALRLLKAL